MNRQEVFDTVLTHLRTQGHAAVYDGKCVYRAENGDKCAIGCLIPDENYHPGLEGRNINHLVVIGALSCELRDRGDREFLSKLQVAHDGSLRKLGRGIWENHMSNIAEDYGLTKE